MRFFVLFLKKFLSRQRIVLSVVQTEGWINELGQNFYRDCRKSSRPTLFWNQRVEQVYSGRWSCNPTLFVSFERSAIIALLALLGSKGISELTVIFSAYPEALWAHAFGVVMATLASGGTYLTNYCYLAANQHMLLDWTHPYVHSTKKSSRWLYIGSGLHVATLCAAFASLVSFLIGVGALRKAFDGLF